MVSDLDSNLLQEEICIGSATQKSVTYASTADMDSEKNTSKT